MKSKAIYLGKIFCLSWVLIMSACKKEEEVDPSEENEVITKVKLNFTNGATTKSFTYSDSDGDGGKPATTFEEISLAANTTYTLTVEIFDESKSPAVNITDEVAKEKDEHLFIYTSSPASLLTYTYSDKDSRNFNVGLTGTAKTGAMGAGKLKFQLRHQPPIGGKPVKDGSVSPGSDDINLDFNLVVK
jgi:hypothetical protein